MPPGRVVDADVAGMPEAKRLLAIAFASSTLATKNGARLVPTDDLMQTQSGNAAGADRGGWQLITPLTTISGDASHAVLFTERAPADEHGLVQAAHPDQATIDVFFFRRRNAEWTLEKRLNKVASAGFFGAVESASTAHVSPSTYAVTFISSSCWQGYCGKWLIIVGLEQERVSVLADGMRMAADDVEAKEGCAEALKSKATEISFAGTSSFSGTAGAKAAASARKLLSSSQCYSVEGRFSFAEDSKHARMHGDLAVSFSGTLALPASKSAPAEGIYTFSTLAIYQIVGGRYRLVHGENPVPRI